ncbi:MAG: hypothetical protein QM504_07790 [Pseudomonadota bacterium]
MSSQEPRCYIRDLDRVKPDSGHIVISFALDQVIKGFYGQNLELLESYIINNEIPQVLRVVARITHSDGLVLVSHDDEFEAFLASMNKEIPTSLCLEYLEQNDVKIHLNSR